MFSTVIVIPCTSSENKKPLPTHVECEINGIKNILLCEQIKTVNNVDLLNYMFTLDDTVMDKVEVALKVALGLIDKNEIVKDVINKPIVVKPEIKVEKEEVKNEEVKSVNISKDSKRRLWSLEDKAEYIEFVEKNGLKKARDKYKLGFNAKQYYFRFCKSLNKCPLEV